MSSERTGARRSGPVYIGGLDRCGKTTMSGFLTTHSRINIPSVGSNMWTYFYRRHGDLADPANLDSCIDALVHYKHVAFLEPDVDRIRREFAAGPATYPRLFELFLRHHAERAGKPRWGAQTGLIERYGDELLAAYPDVAVVHMLRDPRDRYAESLRKWPDGRGRAGGAVARWRYSTRLATRHASTHPDRYLVVRFEDLVADTEATLRRVCSFLGEDFEPAMLSMDGMPTQRDRLASGAASSLLSTEHVGAFAEVVPPEEIAFIDRFAGSLMRAHGYEPVGPDGSGPSRRGSRGRALASNMVRLVAWRSVEELQQRFPTRVPRRPGDRMILRDR